MNIQPFAIVRASISGTATQLIASPTGVFNPIDNTVSVSYQLIDANGNLLDSGIVAISIADLSSAAAGPQKGQGQSLQAGQASGPGSLESALASTLGLTAA